MHTEVPSVPRARIEYLLGVEEDGRQPVHRAWWPIGRGGSTRFLIPTHPSGIKPALELVNSRWSYWALRAGLQISRYTRQPQSIGTALSRIPLDEVLAPIFPDRQLHYAVYCGTHSVYRKYTVQCQDAAGHVLAYAKISEGPRARDSVANEVAVLRQLAGASATVRAAVPAVLGLTERWGHTISVLSGLNGPSRRAPQLPTESIARFVGELFAAGHTVTPWSRSPLRIRAFASVDELELAGEVAAATLLRRAVSVLDEGFGDALLPHGWVHGDFLPWNIRLAPQLYVFDWEWTRLALPLHDVYHYLVFPHLGARRSVRGLLGLRRSAAVRPLLEAALPNDLPYDSDDVRWWQAYLTDAFAFYAESAVADGQLLQNSRLIRNLSELLRLAIDER